MAALAAAFQLGPIYLPYVGLLLAMLSCLPIAVQAYRFPRTAVICAVAATVVILTIATQEAIVFGCSAAPFGLGLGYATRWGWRGWQAALGAAVPLLGGILVMAYLIGLAPLGPELKAVGAVGELGIYVGFALLYSSLWTWFFRLLTRRLQPTMSMAAD